MEKSIECNYQPNIESIDNETKILQTIVKNIYERFMNENNKNNMDYALQVLELYRYVPNRYVIPAGRYVRYIDTSNHQDMKLRLGGFVTYDNKYSFTYKSGDKLVKVNKKHCVVFQSITSNEQLRTLLHED
mgnify:CR=1 FL=1